MKNTEAQRNEIALHKNIVKIYARALCVFVFQKILKKRSPKRLYLNLNQWFMMLCHDTFYITLLAIYRTDRTHF